MGPRRFRIVICRGPECGDRRNSAALQEAFVDAVETNGVRATTEITWQSCFGRCTQGPNVLVRELVDPPGPTLGTGFATLPGPRGVTALYNRIDAIKAARIVVDHVQHGEIVRDFIERPGIHPHDPVASSKR